MQKLDGKNVLVTGASSGIGQAIAVRFAQEGASVAINYRNGAEQAEVTRTMVRDAYMANSRSGRRELFVQADVSIEEQVKTMFARVLDEFGRLDILINNAGIQKVGASHEIGMAEFDRVLNVDVRGPFLCAREAIGIFSRGPVAALFLITPACTRPFPNRSICPIR